MQIWNPWHGCHKISPGCKNCYVYRRDAEFGKDSSVVTKTRNFDLPLRKNRKGSYVLLPQVETKINDCGLEEIVAQDNQIFTCGTSDFFIEEADAWREEAWRIIRSRPDLHFYIVTKRIHRFTQGLPADWGEGYDNVTICCTCENQNRADYRLPIFFSLPIRHREIIHEPMLEAIDLTPHLQQYGSLISCVICGGESGDAQDVRVLDYAWVLQTMMQCITHQVPFHFKQTGTLFRKNNHIYHIPRKDQLAQAAKAGIDFYPKQP